MQERSIVRLVAALALAAQVLSACAQEEGTNPRSAEGDMQQVSITARDYAFDAPSTVKSGLTSFTLRNDGKEPHMAGIMKLNAGVALPQLLDQIKAAPRGQADAVIYRFASSVGGMSAVGPGKSNRVAQQLESGNYVLICFVPSPDGTQHFAKGQVSELTVEGTVPAAREPDTDGTINLVDFAFALPEGVKSGNGTFKVSNLGPQDHEIQMLRLAPGKGEADFKAWAETFAGPPPFEFSGGIPSIPANSSAFTFLDLQPGNYLAVCFVPDNTRNGIPHHAEGMITAFTVS